MNYILMSKSNPTATDTDAPLPPPPSRSHPSKLGQSTFIEKRADPVGGAFPTGDAGEEAITQQGPEPGT